MAVRTIEQLKAWFRKGLYPTESQFSDLIDSFRHKKERMEIRDIDKLSEALNGKYDSLMAEGLEARVERCDTTIVQLGEAQENQGLAISEIHELDEQQQRALETLNAEIDKIRKMLKDGGSLDDALAALTALGDNYKSLYELASTVKTFLESNDTKDETINTWRELELFLQGITDVESLAGLLKELEDRITEAYNNAIDTALTGNEQVVKVAYSELVALRDSGNLMPGKQYRITDYETTVANSPEARSLSHYFDLIVLATDESTLSEEALATKSDRDTEGYFANCKLEGWKVWYCLDNDRRRFSWADTVNGKGVIYRMIDEWGNDCPYDFKNVQFKRYKTYKKGTVIPEGFNEAYVGLSIDILNLGSTMSDYKWFYTFTIYDRENDIWEGDGTIMGWSPQNLEQSGSKRVSVRNNVVSPTTGTAVLDSEKYTVSCLNNIVWHVWYESNYAYITRNYVAGGCMNMTLSGGNNDFGSGCNKIIMGYGCGSNKFGKGCYSNLIGNRCFGNTFGYLFYENMVEYCCNYNIFGNECYQNNLAEECKKNMFGNGCLCNSFGKGCCNNTFGTDCHSNTFGYLCSGNELGNSCGSNSLGNGSSQNIIGNGSENITLGSSNDGNVIGTYCNNNTFVAQSCYNTLGNYCKTNQFGGKMQFVKVGNGVCNVVVLGDANQYIQNAEILSGTSSGGSSPVYISFNAGAKYFQYAGINENGKVWTRSYAGYT